VDAGLVAGAVTRGAGLFTTWAVAAPVTATRIALTAQNLILASPLLDR
jgi:hypothetical protein